MQSYFIILFFFLFGLGLKGGTAGGSHKVFSVFGGVPFLTS